MQNQISSGPHPCGTQSTVEKLEKPLLGMRNGKAAIGTNTKQAGRLSLDLGGSASSLAPVASGSPLMLFFLGKFLLLHCASVSPIC